ncbi:hypothetical protein BH10CYA1_BH10CYA1_53300 [soil metagenome]
MKYQKFLVSFAVAYCLLCSVLFAVDVPKLGMILSLLAETPVSGYYILVMRAELLSYPTATEWGQLPSWDVRKVGDLYWLGLCMNAIMGAYAALAAVLPAAVLAASFAVEGLIKDFAVLNIVVNAFTVTLLLISVVPSLWVLFFLQPLAIVRFAQTNRFSDAFHLGLLTSLSLRQCRFALIGALIMLSATALNIASSLLLPEIVVLSEPTIEFTGIVFAFKFFARSYQRKLTDQANNGCACKTKAFSDQYDSEE